jgi:hypothetical protein
LEIAVALTVTVEMVVALVEKEIPLILEEAGKRLNLSEEQRPWATNLWPQAIPLLPANSQRNSQVVQNMSLWTLLKVKNSS